jgi:tetratricopeptide (TPR) repeat protein
MKRLLAAISLGVVAMVFGPQISAANSNFDCGGGGSEANTNACAARWEAANVRAHAAMGSYGSSARTCLTSYAAFLDRLAAGWVASGKYSEPSDAVPCGKRPDVARRDDGLLAKLCPGRIWSSANRGSVDCDIEHLYRTPPSTLSENEKRILVRAATNVVPPPAERVAVVSAPVHVRTAIDAFNAGLENGSFEARLADFTEAIRLDPNFAEAYTRRGNLFANRGSNDERAIADYTDAIRLDPHLALAYYGRGTMYIKTKVFDHGIADLTEAMRLNPRYALAFNNRGWAYAHLAVPDDNSAIADYTAALSLDSALAASYGGRGASYARKGDNDRAVADDSEAIRLAPTYAEWRKKRGEAYSALGDKIHAAADFEEAHRLDPTFVVPVGSDAKP